MSGRLELALVMDNTGSMNCAARLHDLVNDWELPVKPHLRRRRRQIVIDIVMPDNLTDNDHVKIAVVPFEGQVM